MKTIIDCVKKGVLSPIYKAYGITNLSRIISLCAVLVIVLLPSLYAESQEPPNPSPPDINDCTHIEIQYLPSTLEYSFFTDEEKELLSPEETEYIQSLGTIIADDEKGLKIFSSVIGSSSYIGDVNGTSRQINNIYVVCYREEEYLTSFTIRGSYIETEEKHLFKYNENLLWFSLRTLTPQILPYELRLQCARNLQYLNFWFIMRDFLGVENPYPMPSEWCDVFMMDNQNIDYAEYKYSTINPLRCPSVRQSHYAMNPDCDPNSPPDTVLLFETKTGWNQHGGPELFTFDNHDPKGGCVLLNDGTVKFIRTEEELHSLRWK
jgi:hypothetical protein